MLDSLCEQNYRAVALDLQGQKEPASSTDAAAFVEDFMQSASPPVTVSQDGKLVLATALVAPYRAILR